MTQQFRRGALFLLKPWVFPDGNVFTGQLKDTHVEINRDGAARAEVRSLHNGTRVNL